MRWFAGLLRTIALHASTCPNLDLHITIYVTCLCAVDDVLPIPNCDVLVASPRITEVMKRMIEWSPDPAKAIEEGDVVLDGRVSEDKKSSESTKEGESEGRKPALVSGSTIAGVPIGDGGFAVCASGPERLTREVANAVAKLSASRRGRELGRIGLHTELYAV